MGYSKGRVNTVAMYIFSEQEYIFNFIVQYSYKIFHKSFQLSKYVHNYYAHCSFV